MTQNYLQQRHQQQNRDLPLLLPAIRLLRITGTLAHGVGMDRLLPALNRSAHASTLLQITSCHQQKTRQLSPNMLSRSLALYARNEYLDQPDFHHLLIPEVSVSPPSLVYTPSAGQPTNHLAPRLMCHCIGGFLLDCIMVST